MVNRWLIIVQYFIMPTFLVEAPQIIQKNPYYYKEDWDYRNSKRMKNIIITGLNV